MDKSADLLQEMIITLTEQTDDVFLKGLVGSLNDTMTEEEVLSELVAYNVGNRPVWLFQVNAS